MTPHTPDLAAALTAWLGWFVIFAVLIGTGLALVDTVRKRRERRRTRQMFVTITADLSGWNEAMRKLGETSRRSAEQMARFREAHDRHD